VVVTAFLQWQIFEEFVFAPEAAGGSVHRETKRSITAATGTSFQPPKRVSGARRLCDIDIVEPKREVLYATKVGIMITNYPRR